MPNGHHRSQEAWRELRLAFESVAPTIHVFVDKNELAIEYYYHGFPSWLIYFLRRRGGVGQIQIAFDEEETKRRFRVYASWWVDDYDSETRSSVSRKIGEYQIGQDMDYLTVFLEEALNQIDVWDVDDLCESVGGCTWWKEHWKTAKDFYKAESDSLFDTWHLHYGKKSIR